MESTPEDQSYIENESQELALGEQEGWAGKIRASSPAFRSRNYRLYFMGQLVSLVGTWLQVVAEGWLVFTLSHSAFLVGLDAAAATIPTLFLSLIGGVIVDRYPKKRILIFTQSASMVLAFALGILTVTNVVTVWEIITLAFGLGIVNAIDAPTRQAYVTELIDERKSLASAIALNAGMFNAARVIGPSIAGILIASVGTGTAFLLNGVSYVAVIIALFFITTPMSVENRRLHPLLAIREGLGYVYRHTVIKTLIILSAVVSVFGWSYSTIMPVIATQTFHLSADGLGYLYAAAGLGALLGSIAISAFSQKTNMLDVIIGGNLLFAVALVAFSYVSFLPLALLLLFLIGFGLVTQFALINTLIQHQVDDRMRGRVLSLYTLVFLGFSPFGSLEIGYASEKLGLEPAIRISAVIVLIFGLYILSRLSSLKKLSTSDTPRT